MISKELLDRINELARKSREEGLNDCEASEQQELRKQYLTIFKEGMKAILDNTVIEEPDGTRHKLECDD
jgi:uncharacterized protein YnzC (UPF0291/DUF896 family)